MSKLSSKEREEFWRLALAEYERSGLSVRKFCSREGLSEPSFYAWRSRLRSQDSVDRESQQPRNVTGLLPVNVVPSPKGATQHVHAVRSVGELDGCVCDAHGTLPDSHARVEIATPGGFVVRVREAIEHRRLSSLLQTVTDIERGAASC